MQDNAYDGDYGPTIILQHELAGVVWHSLYGHLSRESLQGKQVGELVSKQYVFASVGPYPENGNRPPHLHFQIIHDLQGKVGDYSGVCQDIPSVKEFYRKNCPDPMIVLGRCGNR